MNMLENKGVQMVLAQLIKSAAPDLIEHVEKIGQLIASVDKRLTAIEGTLSALLEKQERIENGNDCNRRNSSEKQQSTYNRGSLSGD